MSDLTIARATIADMLMQRGFTLKDGDYIKAGVIDSLSLLSWVLDLEDVFNIELTDDEISSDGFRTVKGLTKLIEEKLKCTSA